MPEAAVASVRDRPASLAESAALAEPWREADDGAAAAAEEEEAVVAVVVVGRTVHSWLRYCLSWSSQPRSRSSEVLSACNCSRPKRGLTILVRGLLTLLLDPSDPRLVPDGREVMVIKGDKAR